MSGRLRVYIATAISKGDMLANVERADEAFFRLLRAGFAPFNPVWSVFGGSAYRHGPSLDRVVAEADTLPGNTTHEDWMGADLPWVAVSDAVLRLPGESVGADREVELAEKLGIPVYHDAEELIASPPTVGDERFQGLLRDMSRLHARKSRDYGRGKDPLANLRGSTAVGVEPWRAAWLRAQDKVHRLNSYCLNGNLANESAEDSWMDLSSYCLLTLLLHREAAKPNRIEIALEDLQERKEKEQP